MGCILRIGVMTNFGFTEPELAQARIWRERGWLPLLNTNAKTAVTSDEFPVFLTVNPDVDAFVEPTGKLGNLAAVRVKLVSSYSAAILGVADRAFMWAAQRHVPVLLTMMRFKSRATIARFYGVPEDYEWRESWFRLRASAKERLIKWAGQAGLWVCDAQEEGCPGCRNCAWLSYQQDVPVYGMDLSASGHCPYSCPDCWAKFLVKRSGGRIGFDSPKQNTKQKGHKTG